MVQYTTPPSRRPQYQTPLDRLLAAPGGITYDGGVRLHNPVKVIASGGYCDILLGTHLGTGLTVAMKRTRYIPDNMEDTFRRVRREASTWSTFRHPHIAFFLGRVKIKDDVYLVSPWMKLGNLAAFQSARLRYLADPDAESENETELQHARKLAFYREFHEGVVICQIGIAISYLHSQSYVHGDIKAANILLSEDGSPHLCDFGLSKEIHPGSVTSDGMKGAGTLAWQSPEILDGGAKTYASDVYAFGMTIVEILTGAPPFPKLSMWAWMQAITSGERPKPFPTSRLGVDFRIFWSLASRCWDPEPESRPTMRRIEVGLALLWPRPFWFSAKYHKDVMRVLKEMVAINNSAEEVWTSVLDPSFISLPPLPELPFAPLDQP